MHRSSASPSDSTAYVHPLAATLQQLAVHYATQAGEPTRLIFGLSGRNGIFHLHCRHDTESEDVRLVASFPVRAKRIAFVETLTLLNRLNLHLPGGAFQIDPDDGEITFRHCLHVPQGVSDPAAAAEALRLVESAFDAAIPLILPVATGCCTTAQAFAKPERDLSEVHQAN